MSFLATLFSQSRFERRPRITASRRDVVEGVREIISFGSFSSKSRRAGRAQSTHALSASEKLEQRIALSVSQFANENLEEFQYGANAPFANHPGQVTIASDAGSDIFIQQLDLDPAQLLIADNGSFLNYMAIDNFETNYDDLLVTNGTEIKFGENEVVAANDWWLFPNRDDPTQLTTTRLLLDRPNIRVGPAGGGADFFGSVKMLQGDGSIAEWTFSAWSGVGNNQQDFITITRDGQGASGDPLYITGGPGFGGRPESLNNSTETPVRGQGEGYVFPRSIRVVTEGSGIDQFEGGSEQRSHYLECEWSSVPTSPPIFEANYYGFSFQSGTQTNPGRINGVRTYLDINPPKATQGVAVRSEALVFKLPDAIKGTSIGGSGSLGIVPGTVRGTLRFGVDEGDKASIPSNTFQDRKNINPQNDFLEQTGYSLFYGNLNEASADTPPERQWGKPYSEPSPDDFDLIQHVLGPDGQRQLGVAGYVRNQSELFMKIGSYSGSGGNPNVGYTAAARPLQGFNINVTEESLEKGYAVDAVRVEDVSFLVFVKPTISNDVTFAPGGTIERNVTVDLLSDGSSVFVNSPIQVAEIGGDIDFRATNIFVNAETTSPDYFFLGRSENQNSARLPRAEGEPQGGTEQTPTFSSVIPDEVITKQVNAIPVIEGDEIKELVVLPGNEGYGYDPNNPPTVSFGEPGTTEADVSIIDISGGVDQLILLGSGSGYTLESEDISVTFSDPQLRRIESLQRWGDTPPSEGYSAAPVVAISQPEVVLSAVRIGYGERGRSRAAASDGLGIRLTDSGANYTTEPNVKIQLTQQAKDAGILRFDPNIPKDLEWARAMPSLSLNMDIKDIKGSTGGQNPRPTSDYVYGKVAGIDTQDPGWGLNLTGMDRSSEASFLADINERFEIVITGGSGDPGFGTTILNNWPIGGPLTVAKFEFSRAILGGLKWLDLPTTNGQDPVQDERALLNAGLNYQLSPDVQVFTNLTADVPDPKVTEPDPGENTRESVVAPPSPQGSVLPADVTYATHKISLNNVFAYRDDSGYDSEGNRFDDTKFRDVDYLSYANDPLHADNVVAKVSNDGLTFYDVLVQPFIGLGDTYTESVNVLTSASMEVSANLAAKLSVGDFVVGATFPDGTTVDSVDLETFQVTLSDALLGSNAEQVVTFYDVSKEGDISKDQLRKLGNQLTDTAEGQTTIQVKAEVAKRLGIGDLVVGTTEGIDTDTRVLDVAPIPPGASDLNLVTVTVSKPMLAGSVDQIVEFFDISNKKNVDEYTRQLGVREKPGVSYPGGFNTFITEVTGARIYMHESFEGLELTSAGDAYAVMGKDRARGRAISSEGEITGVEVTHPGSGYTRIPTATIVGGGNGALVTPTVSGGIYELTINKAGFSYIADTVPGDVQGVLRNSKLSLFPENEFGTADPLVDFGERNSSLQGGNVQFPGEGLVIIGNAGERDFIFPNTGIGISGQGTQKTVTPVFTANVSASGVIDSFTQVSGGAGYSIPPTVTVDPPISASDATARAEINAATGSVSEIHVTDGGNRYFVPPKVVVYPPNPRGEGIAATAVAVLDGSGRVEKIVLTSGGTGYVSPPQVVVEPRFDFARTENFDIAANVAAENYELYLSRNEWTERERGRLLVRPQANLANGTKAAANVFIEAAAADLFIEGQIKTNTFAGLMQSNPGEDMFAPFTVSTRSLATNEHSGKFEVDNLLAFTLGNDIPTPQVGSSLVNKFDIQTKLGTNASLRVTAADSVEDPRGAFPYALSVTELGSLTVDAVPRSSAQLSFEAKNSIEFKSALRTDSDVYIKSQVFSQTSPVITEYGAISIEANDVNVLNSLQVLSAPLDENRVDISLEATAGSVTLNGLIEAPNAIEIRQQGNGGSVSGESRLAADRINVNADGDIGISTRTRNISIISKNGDVAVSEIDDLNVTSLTAEEGDVTLQAFGVDPGAEGENAIALTAKILEANSVTVAAPHGSVDVILDTSNLVELGNKGALAGLQGVTAMDVAGSVSVRSTAGAINLFDGPVAGSSARLVRVATTEPLNATHSYQGNTPGAFPSTLSGPGRLPDIDGVSLKIGDIVLVKDQYDLHHTELNDESAENGIYVVKQLGGGVGGYQDWQLVRGVDTDTREDLLPSSFIRVLEGDTLANNVYQLNYANVPELRVSRTENNQLVVSGNVGSLLNININDIATGDGIATGARVTGVDYTNGVISLGVNNSFDATELPVAQYIGQLPCISISGTTQRTDLLLDAINAAFERGESVLVSGAGIPVGAKVSSANGERPKLVAGDLILAIDDIEPPESISIPPDGLKVTLGFVSAASGRVSLNPAVRTFLIDDNVEKTVGNVIHVSDEFTNYGALSEGQLVFGDGVAPNTVITKIFPGKKEVHVSPNGLPEDVTYDSVQSGKPLVLEPGASDYFGELYTNYLQMPDTFNEYFRLSVGQSVEGPGIAPGAVITAFSPVYRQIGLSEGSITLDSITQGTIFDEETQDYLAHYVDFKPIDSVDFGVINNLGSGTASFSVDTFGYVGMDVRNPRVASGLAKIKLDESGDPSTNTVVVDSLSGSIESITADMEVSGVGIHDGYRVLRFDGRTLSLYSATLTDVGDETVVNGDYRYEITLDDGFSSFSTLRTGMEVTGPAIVADDTSSSVTPTVSLFIDQLNQKVFLSSDLKLDISKLREFVPENYFIFGDVFKSNLLASNEAQSAISFHGLSPSLTTFIGSDNTRQRVRYQVTSDEGMRSPGSLATILSVAQENSYVPEATLVGQKPTITFGQAVSRIELDSPLPVIDRRPVVIDGSMTIDEAPRASVTIDGRFITTTANGSGLASDTVIHGLVVSGEKVSETVVKGLRIGGFGNGSNLKIENASNVLVENVVVGQSSNNTRAGAQVGIHVASSDSANGLFGATSGTTILNATVVGSSSTGIKIDGPNTTSTTIVGSTVGTEEIINSVGIEVLSSDTAIGVSSITPRITKGLLADEVYTYNAEYLAGSNEVKLLDATVTEWDQLKPGLVVAGVGLSADTKIVSVDRAKSLLVLDKTVSRGASEALLIIGHSAGGVQNTNVLTLSPSVPLQNVHLGQRIRLVSNIPSAEGTAVTKEYAIIGMNLMERSLYLNEKITDGGMGSDSIRLIEFVAPNQNRINYNNTGISVGIYAKVNGTPAGNGQPQVVVPEISFENWTSISVGQEVFGTGADGSVVVTGVDPGTREITLSEPLPGILFNQVIRFGGSDGLSVVNSQISENVDDGVVIAGGQHHNFGEYKEVDVYDSAADAQVNLPSGWDVLELVSGGLRISIDQEGEFTVGSSVVSNAIHDLITVAEGTTDTTLLGTTITLNENIGGISVGDAVLGEGISLGSKVVSIDQGTITLSQPMAQTRFGAKVRFLKEDHEDLNKVSVYGSLSTDPLPIQSFNVATDRIRLDLIGVEETAQVYFGLGKWVQVDPSATSAFAPDWVVEGEGNGGTEDPVFRVPGDTTVETIFHAQSGGYIALSATEAGNEHMLLPGKVVLDELRFARRDAASNSFTLNGGYAITTPEGSDASLYEDISATWTVAGSYVGIYEASNGNLIRASNQQGSLDTSIFAKLMVDGELDQLFSRYAKTDRYGNQYALPEAVPVDGEDDGEVLLPPEVPDPDPDPTDPDPNPDPDPDPVGDPPSPEDEIWPGLPF